MMYIEVKNTAGSTRYFFARSEARALELAVDARHIRTEYTGTTRIVYKRLHPMFRKHEGVAKQVRKPGEQNFTWYSGDVRLGQAGLLA